MTITPYKITLLVLIIIICAVISGCRSDQTTAEVSSILQTETPESTLSPAAETSPVPTEVVVITPDATQVDVPVQIDPYSGVDPTNQTITFWHPFYEEQETALQEIINDFNSTNQWGISVVGEFQGGYEDLHDKMMASINNNEAPSLLVSNPTQAAVYWLTDSITDINQFVNHVEWGLNDNEKNDFFPGLYSQSDSHSFGDVRLSFPIFGNMSVLFYNVDWLEELGFANSPESPEGFRDAACSATRQPFSGSTDNKMKGLDLQVSPSSFADWIFSFGGRIYDQGLEQYKYDSSAANEAMSYLHDLLIRGCATHNPSDEGKRTEFGKGILLFTVDSIDKIPDYRASVQAEANFNWRIAPLPHTTNQPVSNVSGAYVSIPKTTPENQLAAWLFTRYFSTPEVQAKWVKGTNTLPVKKDASIFLGDYFSTSPAYQMTFDLLRTSVKEPEVPGYSVVRELALQTFINIVNGTDVSSALTQLNTDANQLLDEQLVLLPEKPDPWLDVDPNGQTITFWHQYSDSRQDAFEEIINEFNASNKWGISVVPVRKDGYGDIFLELLNLIGTKDSPNLVMAYQHHAAAYHAAGGLVDITSLIESTKWGLTPREVDNFIPSVFEQDVFNVFDGVRLGFPVQRSTDVLYYNQDWLAELGYENPPSTPNEFKRMACAANSPFSDSTAETSQGYYFYIDATRFTSWVFAFGGNIFDGDKTRFTYNSESVNSATNFFSDLIESGCASPILDRSEAQIAFSDGSLLFMVDSSFHIPAVTTLVNNYLGFDWAVAPIPSTVDEHPQSQFGASISIPEGNPETELAAWLFIKFFSTPETQAKWGQGSGYLPTNRAAADFLSDYFDANPNYQAAFELLKEGQSGPSIPGLDFVFHEVELALAAIFAGEDIDETLAALNASTNQVLVVHLER